MHRYSNGRILLTAIVLLTVLAYAALGIGLFRERSMSSTLKLLTDPFLQLPTESAVRVVWFTEFEGDRHWVTYGPNLSQTAVATTTKLSRTREDFKSRVGTQTEDGQDQQPVMRAIWRHEAVIEGLAPGTRVPYRVTSMKENGTVTSDEFTAAPNPAAGTPLKILLTSDHQLKPMTPANLQKVVETVGQVDAVFFAGDFVNIPDRASEWFDDNREVAFFPSLQGRVRHTLEKNGVSTSYTGGALIQYAPLFPAIGNHEVMGRFSMETGLNDQFDDSFPQAAAEKIYVGELKQNPADDPVAYETWLKNNSFNADTYREIFTLPDNSPGGENYYAVTFGDVRLVVLYATNIWRTPKMDAGARGRYQERKRDLGNPTQWGYGQHIFEAIAKGSLQYNWLQQELNSLEFQQAKYKVVMFHHPPHSLGENIVPAYTNPVQVIEHSADGQIAAIRYEYPKEADYLIRDVVPLLESAGVQLVFYGHSHLWNRFVSTKGTHFLETSNVGNSYGAYIGNETRNVPSDYQEEYAATGDPNGLEPVMPAIAPLTGEDGQPQPYIASNDITVFSIFDTQTGTISSYRFDTREPDSEVVKFDEFQLVPLP